MDLPVNPPVKPMLAKPAAALPTGDGWFYEPKWDGFRCIVFRDGDEVELGSRNERPLTRYFPDVVEAVKAHMPERCVIDGEIVVRSGEPGHQRLDWDVLAQRIHPADSRVRRLAEETPAEIVAFDLLADGDEDLMPQPFAERRERLERLFASMDDGTALHLTRTTRDADLASRWFEQFEGAGLDGVVAKPLAASYQPGKRVMLKVKHHREADVVVIGYRVHKSGQGVGSLLLGLYDAEGQLRQVGGASAFSDARRLELVDELEPLVALGDGGERVVEHGERSRFTGDRDVSWVRLRPELVAQVRYDQLENGRFRHTVQVERFRPDRDPASCRYDQLEQPIAYDLDGVLQAE
jgi:ATP-dependent DNA ligase